MRRIFVISIISLFFSASLAVTGSLYAQELKIRVGYNKTWGVPVFLVGKAKGFFVEQGVNVAWLEFGNPNQVTEGIIADALDAGASTGPHLVVAYEKGVKMKAVSVGQGRSYPDTSYLVRTDAAIDKIEDLKGKRIGVNNYGGNMDIYLRYILEKHGIDPKRDVQILEVPIPAVLPSLLAKKIDSGALLGMGVRLAEGQYPGQFKPLFSFRDVHPGALNNMIIVMGTKYIDKNRTAAKRFLSGYLRAIKFIAENPKESLAIWAKEAGFPLITSFTQPPDLPADGKVDGEAMILDIKLLKRFGYTRSEPEVKEVVDNSLLDEVLAGKL